MERVLPDARVKERMADLAIGLSSDCDNPEREVGMIMQAKLASARTLPFVGFITHDGKWVAGFSGRKSMGDFIKVLETAENTPYLKASEAVRKKLAGLIPRAEKAAAKGAWKSVVKVGQTAAKTTGRCPERTRIAALVDKARAWARTQFEAAIRLARSGDGVAESRKLLFAVKNKFAGEPEAVEAAEGLKALRRLVKIQKSESGGSASADIREKAVGDFKDSRWASIFVKKAAGEDGDEGEEVGDEKEDEDDEESEIEIG